MSLVVVMGSNRFTGCLNLIAHKDQPILRVLENPLRVTLRTPSESKGGVTVTVDENRNTSLEAAAKQSMQVTAGPEHVVLLWKEMPIVLATCNAQTVHLRLDLRPLGVNVYDDVFALHIGNNTLSNNLFENCTTAINLG